MEDIKPGYYAVIPANVRYSKEISNGAKLLYAEITCLSNMHGYCWASNKYFAELYDVKSNAVSRWISELAKAGFILTIVDNAAGNSRKIWLSETQGITKKAATLSPKKVTPSHQKSSDPITKKGDIIVKENNKENSERENERFAPPAPAENLQPVEAEIPKSGLVPPPAAQTAAAPFTAPRRVDTVDEAEEIIMEWAVTDQGRESIRKWYADAFRDCNQKDVKEMVSKFAGVYLTIGDEGKRQRMAQDPLQFFKYTFKMFLKKEVSHTRTAFGVQTPQPHSSLPRSLQNLVGK